MRATAFHEAGHALMAYLQRVSFRQVSIAPDAETFGRVLLGAWPDWANPDSCEYRERAAYDYFLRRARVSLAGQIAEAHHLGKPPRSGMHIDNCQVADRAHHLCRGVEETANAMLEWLYLDTRDRLTSPLVWPAVETLADAPVERKTLGAGPCVPSSAQLTATGDFSLVALRRRCGPYVAREPGLVGRAARRRLGAPWAKCVRMAAFLVSRALGWYRLRWCRTTDLPAPWRAAACVATPRRSGSWVAGAGPAALGRWRPAGGW